MFKLTMCIIKPVQIEEKKKWYSPNAIQNEKKLNKNTAKRQDTTHDDTRQWLCEKWLLWDLARNLVCTHWMLNRLQKK